MAQSSHSSGTTSVPTSRLVFVLNGPNLNLLGKRQPHIYGRETLADVERDCRTLADELGQRTRDERGLETQDHFVELGSRVREAARYDGAEIAHHRAIIDRSVADAQADAHRPALVLHAHAQRFHRH